MSKDDELIITKLNEMLNLYEKLIENNDEYTIICMSDIDIIIGEEERKIEFLLSKASNECIQKAENLAEQIRGIFEKIRNVGIKRI